MTGITASAVVYGEKKMTAPVNQAWVDAALAFLSSHGLPIREYDISQTPTGKGALHRWPEDRERLLREVNAGHIRALGLYAHPELKQDLVMSWQGLTYVDLEDGFAYLGLPVAFGVSLVELLRTADQFASLVAPAHFHYGIGYLYPTLKGPEWYAAGIDGCRTSDLSKGLSGESRSQLGKWYRDFRRTRSYLQGSFRDVYPANLLSEDHIRAALPGGKKLESLGIGRLSLLGPGKWLWEVSEDEIPQARAVLREAGLLICT